MPSQPTPSDVPIACDMTHAVDTPPQRLAEYEQLFATVLIGRERTAEGIRFRFRERPGLEAQVRDLAAREQACCAFFIFTVSSQQGEVWWDASVIDDDLARQILEEFYRLPVTIGDSQTALHARFNGQGLQVVIDDEGTRRPVMAAELRAAADRAAEGASG